MREFFKRIDSVLVSSIKLDPKNIRFDDEGGDLSQVECLNRMMEGKDGEKLIKLAEHIAQHGIGVMPIVVTKDKNGTYIVRDGNRRVAALQMLLNPDRCKRSAHYRGKFVAARNKYENRGNIENSIECLPCSNERALDQHLYITHAGEMDGVGQVVHQTRARDRLRGRLHGKPTRHGQVNEWLQNHATNIPGIAFFNLSTIQRLINSKTNLSKLGFTENEDKVVSAILPEIEICYIWSYIVETVKNVGDVYHAEPRNKKIDEAVAYKNEKITGSGEDRNGKNSSTSGSTGCTVMVLT